MEIALLEALRARTQQEERAFYLDLLRTPFRDREAVVVEWIEATTPTGSRAEILREISPIVQGLRP